MPLRISKRVSAVLAAVFVTSFSTLALAQDYPNRPVRVIVPYPPGGPTDVIVRVVVNRLTESGLPGFDHSNWYGVWGTPGLPREVISKLSTAIAATMQKKDVRDRLVDLGADPVDGVSPAQFEAYAQSELARFAKIVKQAGVKME